MARGSPLASATKAVRRRRPGTSPASLSVTLSPDELCATPSGATEDEGAVILLVLALDEGVAGDDSGGAVAEIDHVVGAAALAVVETAVGDLDPGATALHIMAAGAALEAGADDGERAGAAIVDGVRAALILRTQAEAGKGRLLDADRAVMVVGNEDAVLAVAERGIADDKVAVLEPYAGAVEIRHAQVLEDDAFDPGRAAAQHQRRLALAGNAVEQGGSGLARDKGDTPRFLHRALAVTARRDQDGAAAATDRGDSVGERTIAAPAFLDRERRRARLRRQRRRGEEAREDRQGDEPGHRANSRSQPLMSTPERG